MGSHSLPMPLKNSGILGSASRVPRVRLRRQLRLRNRRRISPQLNGKSRRKTPHLNPNPRFGVQSQSTPHHERCRLCHPRQSRIRYGLGWGLGFPCRPPTQRTTTPPSNPKPAHSQRASTRKVTFGLSEPSPSTLPPSPVLVLVDGHSDFLPPFPMIGCNGLLYGAIGMHFQATSPTRLLTPGVARLRTWNSTQIESQSNFPLRRPGPWIGFHYLANDRNRNG